MERYLQQIKKAFAAPAVVFVLLTTGLSHTYGQGLRLDWAKSFGAQADERGQSVVTDETGSAYVTGYYTDSAHFGPVTIYGHPGTVTNRKEIFLAKYDASGNEVWAKGYHSEGWNEGRALAYDNAGHVYGTGHFNKTVDFGNGQSVTTIATTAYIFKMDTAGNCIWARNIDPTNAFGYSYGYDITTDPLGNVYITGYFGGTINFHTSGGSHNITTSGADIFVMKLDSLGNMLWARNMPCVQSSGSSGIIGFSIASDPLGAGVYMTGQFRGTISFPNSSLPSATAVGSDDLIITKLDSAGNFIWAKAIGTTAVSVPLGFKQSVTGRAVTTGRSGNVYITGRFGGRTDFNPGGPPALLDLVEAGEYKGDGFVLKLDSAGNHQWVRHWGGKGSATAYGWDIGTDQRENVYSVGFFQGRVGFNLSAADSAIRITVGSSDIAIVKFDSSGNFLLANTMGGLSVDELYGIGMDGSGNAYVTGRFHDSTDADPSLSDTFMVYSRGGEEGLLIRLSCGDISDTTMHIEACDAFTVNNNTYTEPGTIKFMLPNVEGCDSVVTINLTFRDLAPVINPDGMVLSVTRSFRSYHWMLNGDTITGARDSAYIVLENGDYQVIVIDEDGCRDTSKVYTVNNVGLNDYSPEYTFLKLVPNPNRGRFMITGVVQGVNADLVIYNQTGQVVFARNSVPLHDNKLHVDVQTELAAGVYYLKVQSSDMGGRVYPGDVMKMIVR